MGSEQSHPSNVTTSRSIHGRPNTAAGTSGNGGRLQRGNTIAVTERRLSNAQDETRSAPESRPVSPPISVCSDSDLPYVSYTNRPIGDSPKHRNKSQTQTRNNRNAQTSAAGSVTAKKTILSKTKAKSVAHDIVVVREANKKFGPDRDPDLQKLQHIPQFLPVMRGTILLPANRDPEVLERLQPDHLKNMCNRMQVHLNLSATQVANDQARLSAKVKEVDYETTKVFNSFTEKQKLYASYAEQFSKLHHITQQLSRCNILLNQNLESMDVLNNMLDIDDRLPPFVWKTSDSNNPNICQGVECKQMDSSME